MRDPLLRLAGYISENGLKNTPQRRRIAEVFFRSGKHLSTEELYDMVRGPEYGIGQATVYRTLKLLCRAGLAKEHHFGDNTARYEALDEMAHHDHLICTGCGKNVEIVDEDIERHQELLASRNGFQLTSHRMVLYGLCADCAAKKQTAPDASPASADYTQR
ncbi:MAG: transcriptional repressor [Desulfovibrio sp.]|jgi:Fur family ferric uptake transcriptional regulator|nr:transcriptional repressor [Desulfovibrio sp.]